jgi:hypothetical protein
MEKARQELKLMNSKYDEDDSDNDHNEMKIKVWAMRFKDVFEMSQAIIENYNPSKKEFECFWLDTLEEEKLKRIQICFETEDPEKYIKRLLEAISKRKKMIAQLKYQHFVNCMPTEELNEMEIEQKER